MGLFDFLKSRPVPEDEYVPPPVKLTPTLRIKESAPVKAKEQKHYPNCPSCHQPIEAVPKRSGTCIHCKQKYYMCKDPENGKYIFTNSEGKKAMEKRKLYLINLEGSRNNTASFEAAQENSEGVKKEWLFIPGLEESSRCKQHHQDFQALGLVPMNYEYAPGLKYPGDPHCKDPKELEWCWCSICFGVD
jgi:hypothetical protein